MNQTFYFTRRVLSRTSYVPHQDSNLVHLEQEYQRRSLPHPPKKKKNHTGRKGVYISEVIQFLCSWGHMKLILLERATRIRRDAICAVERSTLCLVRFMSGIFQAVFYQQSSEVSDYYSSREECTDSLLNVLMDDVHFSERRCVEKG